MLSIYYNSRFTVTELFNEFLVEYVENKRRGKAALPGASLNTYRWTELVSPPYMNTHIRIPIEHDFPTGVG
jgi:hypothetical protein